MINLMIMDNTHKKTESVIRLGFFVPTVISPGLSGRLPPLNHHLLDETQGYKGTIAYNHFYYYARYVTVLVELVAA